MRNLGEMSRRDIQYSLGLVALCIAVTGSVGGAPMTHPIAVICLKIALSIAVVIIYLSIGLMVVRVFETPSMKSDLEKGELVLVWPVILIVEAAEAFEKGGAFYEQGGIRKTIGRVLTTLGKMV